MQLIIEKHSLYSHLCENYKANPSEELPELNPLSLILKKAELGIDLANSEWIWLEKNKYNETIQIIKNKENYRNSIRREIKKELIHLKQSQHLKVSINSIPSLDSTTPLVLYKINILDKLYGEELGLAKDEYNDIVDFEKLKSELLISENPSFDKRTLKLLQKLKNKILLTTEDAEYIKSLRAPYFFRYYDKQFFKLIEKYSLDINKYKIQRTDYIDIFIILLKIDTNQSLVKDENKYLKDFGLNEFVEFCNNRELLSLGHKFKVPQSELDKPNSHIYKILIKIKNNVSIAIPDINFLKKRNFIDTLKLALAKDVENLHNKIKNGEDLTLTDINWCEEHYFHEFVFSWLSSKYEIKITNDKLDLTIYQILKKIESGIRLNDENIVWLNANKLFHNSSKIYIVYNLMEAEYLAEDFKRTKNYWSLVNASAHYRKGNKPHLALHLTKGLNVNNFKQPKLGAAILTTQGGALRDIGENQEAEKCALEAIKLNHQKHNPYTLMGALCFDARRYEEGSEWFEKAVERGAQQKDQDSEIKRILMRNKDKNLSEYLLQKDPFRFAWVKSFISTATSSK